MHNKLSVRQRIRTRAGRMMSRPLRFLALIAAEYLGAAASWLFAVSSTDRPFPGAR